MESAFAVLIFHPIAWSHYKAAVFSELDTLAGLRGLEVHVSHLAQTGLQRKVLGSIDRAIHKYRYSVLFEGAYEEFGFLRKASAVLALIASRRWSIVVFPGYNDPVMWLALILCKLRRTKAVIAIDSTELDHPRNRYRESFKKVFVRLCDMAFCYGVRARDYAVKLGLSREKTVTKCQAIDAKALLPLHQASKVARDRITRELSLSRFNFIYVGRLSAEKNVKCVISAFEKLYSELPEWGLVVVGDGPEREKLQDSVSQRKLTRVYFAGGQEWREVARFLAVSDVFILPSLSEPWGLVVNEALACGLPVVVSQRCGCCPELVIDGRTGFTFDPRDSDSLAEKMKLLAQDAFVRDVMGKQGKVVVGRYTPRRAAATMCRAFLRLVK